MKIPFTSYEIRKIKKRKSARERCDCRGARREFQAAKLRAIETLRREQGRNV